MYSSFKHYQLCMPRSRCGIVKKNRTKSSLPDYFCRMACSIILLTR